MPAPAPPTGSARWMPLAALVVLAAGLAIAVWQTRAARSPGIPPAVGAEPPEQVIDQALRQVPAGTRARALHDSTLAVAGAGHPAVAAIDSTAYKHRWLDEVRGVDVAGLDARRLELFLRFSNTRECTCGCGYTLAGCRASDMTCEVSGPALVALRDSIVAGWITRARRVRARPVHMRSSRLDGGPEGDLSPAEWSDPAPPRGHAHR